MSQMRDLPPIAGAIIWARQIEPQLLTYIECVKDVPGKGWELYAKGQKLQSDSAAFRKKNSTRDQSTMHGYTISTAGIWVSTAVYSRLSVFVVGVFN